VRFVTAILALAAACTLATDVAAQGNNNDYTPLNSRIRRERQFPTSLVNRWADQTNEVSRQRNRAMLAQFSKCVYNRSREGSLALLAQTDYGFNDFAQVGVETDRAVRTYGFRDCLSRVASTHGTGVQLRFSAGGLRQWLLEEAYFARFPDAPSWLRAGYVIGPRTYPLSAGNPGVSGPMDFADCVVAADPYTADFFYRTTADSVEEKQAIEALMPALGPCLPQGQRVDLSPYLLRLWLGEGLWHAANNSVPAEPSAAVSESTD
jgi:hypothetical protein